MENNEDSTNKNQQPVSLRTPNPKRFALYSKAVGLEITGRLPGDCDDPQYEFLCAYGMPTDRMSLTVTIPGIGYGKKFEEFSIEFFGVEGSEPAEIAGIELKRFGSVEGCSVDLQITAQPDQCISGGYLTVETETQRFVTEFWRCRIFLDRSSLCLEMLWHGSVIGWREHVISRPFEPAAQYRRMAKAANLRDAIMAETNGIRGGDRNPKEIQELWSDANCKDFAKSVKDLAPKWEWIKSNNYDPNFSSPQEWVKEVRRRSDFKKLFGGSKKPINDLLLRITDTNLSKADREPVALACMQAARELGITDVYQKHMKPEPAASTLRRYYKKGRSLLKNNRSEQN